MKISKFEIENFKGISNTTINLADEVPGNVITLIGLNESGKTTILESLSHFVTEDKQTAALVGKVHKKSSLQDMIPKDRKAAFTGKTSIKAHIELDSKDIDGLAEFFLKKHGLVLDKENYSKKLTVESAFLFEDSTNKESPNYWTVTFPLRTKQAKKYVTYNHLESTKAIWLSGIAYLRDLIPKIVYFPTFLFNFPDRIYLEEATPTETNSYYKQILQDVLDCQSEGLSITKHVLDRINKQKAAHNSIPTFIAHFWGLDEKNQIDAVMQKISNEMSREIFGAWSEILGRNIANKRVQVDWFIDSEKNNSPYLQLSIIDGQSKYVLSERSLGFRWFFSFLLFTQFRKKRENNHSTIFIFDEPAANLHSKAQMKLLESFSKIATDNTYIIYSTHSHYMVNPQWLEKAYIVDNKAIDYDNDQVDSFAIKKTDIHATKYRTFIGSHPNKTTYFQPVLDALEVQFSPLERSAKALIIEGKFDYHPFLYFRKKLNAAKIPEIFPSNGAGEVGHLINLFRGWGVDFRILLDDDNAGKEAKKRYLTDFLVPQNHVVTIADIDPTLKNKAFEAIYQNDVTDEIKKTLNVKVLTKRHFALFFQEMLINSISKDFPETVTVFKKLSSWVDNIFETNNAEAA